MPDDHRHKKRKSFKTFRKSAALVRLLWPLTRPHRGMLVSGIALSGLYVGLRVAQPWPLKWIIDGLSGDPSPRAWLDGGSAHGVVVLSVLFIAIAFGAALCEYGQRIILAGLGNRVVFSFRTQIFQHVLSLPLAFHNRRETGELITRIVYDTARLRQGLRGLLVKIFQNLFLFASIFAVLAWLHPGLAVVIAVGGIALVVRMGGTMGRIRRASLKSRKREGKLASVVADSLLGIRELQAFRRADLANSRFSDHNRKSLRQEQKTRRLAAGLVLQVEVILAATVAVILWLGTVAIRAGAITVGDLVLFISYVTSLSRPYRQFASQSARMGRTFACADRLVSLLHKRPAIADLPGALPAPPLKGDIHFEGVSLKSSRRLRQGRKWILKNVSFRVEPGERVAVTGGNGAGKSTLLRMVLRLADPDNGTVRIDGRDVREYTLESIRRQMSVVFQESLFFGLSVHENIAFGRPDATRADVERVARAVKIESLVGKLKHGYDTTIRQRGVLFSGGERQKIALARAMLQAGRVWLLDEPTTGLDAATADELVATLFEAADGRTLLWITHDQALIHRFDRVIVIGDGRIDRVETPGEYLAFQAGAADINGRPSAPRIV